MLFSALCINFWWSKWRRSDLRPHGYPCGEAVDHELQTLASLSFSVNFGASWLIEARVSVSRPWQVKFFSRTKLGLIEECGLSVRRDVGRCFWFARSLSRSQLLWSASPAACTPGQTPAWRMRKQTSPAKKWERKGEAAQQKQTWTLVKKNHGVQHSSTVRFWIALVANSSLAYGFGVQF